MSCSSSTLRRFSDTKARTAGGTGGGTIRGGHDYLQFPSQNISSARVQSLAPSRPDVVAQLHRHSRMTWVRTIAITLLALATPVVGAATADGPQGSRDTRLDLIRRAQVWTPVDTVSLNLLEGPQDPHGFAPAATVTCDYVRRTLSGHSPKFA